MRRKLSRAAPFWRATEPDTYRVVKCPCCMLRPLLSILVLMAQPANGETLVCCSPARLAHAARKCGLCSNSLWKCVCCHCLLTQACASGAHSNRTADLQAENLKSHLHLGPRAEHTSPPDGRAGVAEAAECGLPDLSGIPGPLRDGARSYPSLTCAWPCANASGIHGLMQRGALPSAPQVGAGRPHTSSDARFSAGGASSS